MSIPKLNYNFQLMKIPLGMTNDQIDAQLTQYYGINPIPNNSDCILLIRYADTNIIRNPTVAEMKNSSLLFSPVDRNGHNIKKLFLSRQYNTGYNGDAAAVGRLITCSCDEISQFTWEGHMDYTRDSYLMGTYYQTFHATDDITYGFSSSQAIVDFFSSYFLYQKGVLTFRLLTYDPPSTGPTPPPPIENFVDLHDVNIHGPAAGQWVRWNNSTMKWESDLIYIDSQNSRPDVAKFQDNGLGVGQEWMMAYVKDGTGLGQYRFGPVQTSSYFSLQKTEDSTALDITASAIDAWNQYVPDTPSIDSNDFSYNAGIITYTGPNPIRLTSTLSVSGAQSDPDIHIEWSIAQNNISLFDTTVTSYAKNKTLTSAPDFPDEGHNQRTFVISVNTGDTLQVYVRKREAFPNSPNLVSARHLSVTLDQIVPAFLDP